MNKGIVTRQVFVRALTAEQIENREVEFVISTTAVDRHNTVFTRDGWDIEGYNSNPVVLYIHDMITPDPDLVVGISRIYWEGDDMIGVVKFDPEDINPLAEKVFRKIQHGTLRMASVNTYVNEARWGNVEDGEAPDVLYFTKKELIEWSIVPVGSNREALKRNNEFIQSFKKPEQSETNIKKRSLAVTEAEVELKLKMFK